MHKSQETRMNLNCLRQDPGVTPVRVCYSSAASELAANMVKQPLNQLYLQIARSMTAVYLRAGFPMLGLGFSQVPFTAQTLAAFAY